MFGFVSSLLGGYLSFFLSVLCQFCLVPVLLDAVGRDLSGFYLLLLTIANFASVSIGWVVTPMQRKMIYSDHKPGPDASAAYSLLWWVMVVIAVGFAILCLIASSLVGWLILVDLPVQHHVDVQWSIIGLGMFVVATWTSQADLVLLTARRRQTDANFLRCVTPAFFLTVLSVFHVQGWGRINILMWGNVAGALITLALVKWRVARLGWRLAKARPEWAALVVLMRGEGGDYLIFSVAQFALLYGDMLIIGLILGPRGAAEYVIVWRIAEAGMTVVVRISETLAPYLTRLQAQGDNRRLCWLNIIITRSILSCAALFGVIYALFGQTLAAWWVGGENVPNKQSLFIASGLMSAVSIANRHEIVTHVALGAVRQIISFLILEALCKYTLIAVSISWFGLITVMLSGCATGLFVYFYYRRSANTVVGVSWKGLFWKC